MKYEIEKFIKQIENNNKNKDNSQNMCNYQCYKVVNDCAECDDNETNKCDYENKIDDLYKKIKCIKKQNKIKNEKQNETITNLKQYITKKCSNLNQDIKSIMNQSNVCFTDTNEILQFIVPKNINLIFVTMVAGGGAGGIGYCANQYFYGGGGGGAGACIIKKPIFIDPDSILHIKVGNGGKSNIGMDGEDSYIEYVRKSRGHKICVKGGINGHPKIINKETNELSHEINGGDGGKKCYPYLCGENGNDGKLMMYNYNFTGVTGENGVVSFPSGPTATSGTGGCSLYERGGRGGTNYFASGGCSGTINNSIGENGEFGSGGGGSLPKYKLDFKTTLSGNGGDGIVIIEFGNNFCELKY